MIPLTKAPALTKKPIARLTPSIDIDGERYLLMMPQLAGIARSELGAAVWQRRRSAKRDRRGAGFADYGSVTVHVVPLVPIALQMLERTPFRVESPDEIVGRMRVPVSAFIG